MGPTLFFWWSLKYLRWDHLLTAIATIQGRIKRNSSPVPCNRLLDFLKLRRDVRVEKVGHVEGLRVEVMCG